MTVNIDPESGFCAGVVNAIELAEKSLDGGRVFSLGDIVHNRLEMERLEGLGLGTIDHAGLREGMTVLVRAHGEPPSTYRLARSKGVTIIDATCPVVAKLQKTVAEAHRKMTEVGGQVVILGKRGHAEVVGLTGQVNGGAEVIVVENEGDLDTGLEVAGPDLPERAEGGAEVPVVEKAVDFGRPIYFLSQTTQSLELFGRLSEVLRARAHDTIVIHDTICRAVANRERRLGDFARAHDVVVFVSGRKSSNGRLLFEACRAANPRSYMVEDETELHAEWFSGALTVGVCGATSTPGWVMGRVAKAVDSLRGGRFHVASLL